MINIFQYLFIIYIVFIAVLLISGFIVFKNKSMNTYKSKLRYYEEYHRNNSIIVKIANAIPMLYCIGILVAFVAYIDSLAFKDLGGIYNIIIGFEGGFITFVALIISAIIFAETLTDKGFYLIFTRKEALSRCGINKCYKNAFICCVISIVSTALFAVNFNTIIGWIVLAMYQISVVFALIYGIKAVFIVANVSFDDGKNELKMLNNLYEVFWQKCEIHLKDNIDKSDINYNLSYLVYAYRKSYDKINKKCRISDLRYITVDNKERWRKYSVRRIRIIGFILFLISIFCCLNINNLNILSTINQKGIVINIVAFLIGLVATTKSFSHLLGYRGLLADLVFGKRGFLIKYYNNKFKVVSDISVFNTKNIKYINSIKNIMAFYHIVLKNVNDKRIIEKSYLDFIDYLREFDNNNFDKGQRALYYMPIILSGYYYYIKFNTVPTVIKELLKCVDLSKEDKTKFHNSVIGFIIRTQINTPGNAYGAIEKGYWKALF